MRARSGRELTLSSPGSLFFCSHLYLDRLLVPVSSLFLLSLLTSIGINLTQQIIAVMSRIMCKPGLFGLLPI